jgi:hypothetical protein
VQTFGAYLRCVTSVFITYRICLLLTDNCINRMTAAVLSDAHFITYGWQNNVAEPVKLWRPHIYLRGRHGVEGLLIWLYIFLFLTLNKAISNVWFSYFSSEILLTDDRDGVWLAFWEMAQFSSRLYTYWFIIDMPLKCRLANSLTYWPTAWELTNRRTIWLFIVFRDCVTNHEFVTNIRRPVLVGNIPSCKILTEEEDLNRIYMLWPTIARVYNAFITYYLSSTCFNTVSCIYTHLEKKQEVR